MRNHILFDLDGTLTDPRQGIIGCIRYALEMSGRHAPPEEELLWCIGPSLYSSFPKIVPGLSQEEVLTLVEHYRERFSATGLFENKVYEGIPELLQSLSGRDLRLYLATAKPHVFAKRIMVHFGLDSYFVALHGSELSGIRTDKSELVKFILETEKIPANEAAMVGDTKFDMIGAKKNGLLALGITWGYGSRSELAASGADHIFDSREELGLFLKSQ